jgi:outer membrane lipoprotein carrier protein
LLMSLLIAVSVQGLSGPEQLLEKAQVKYQSLQSLRASFTQTYRSSRFSRNITEKGMVWFQKGGKMKWEYLEPEKKVFLSDGADYYYYLPEEKQVIKAPMMMRNGEQHSPTLFLAGRGDFMRDFGAQWSSPNPSDHLLKLTPLTPQPDFRYLIVDVAPSTGLILRLTAVDDYDNRTEFTFQSIEENPPLPDHFFAFHAPPGTDVIYQKNGDEE